MLVIDASSIVYAWDNYPSTLFPQLWLWLEEACADGNLCIPKPALEEVGHVSPDCHAWLLASGISVLPITNAVLVEATRIKTQLGIANDQYHPTGVDENDLLIIATARTQGCQLISNEAAQPSLPNDQKRYKIPAVCMKHAPPPCLNFLGYLRQTGAIF